MITLSYLDLLLAGLVLVAIIAVIYIIVLLKDAVPSVKKLEQTVDSVNELLANANKSLEDANEILANIGDLSNSAKKGVESAQEAVKKVGKSAKAATALLPGAIKNGPTIVKAAGIAVSMVGIVSKLHKNKKKKEK